MNRKRIMAAVTAALMCFGMSACSGQEKPAETTAEATATTAASTTKTEAETTAQKEESKTEETTAAENSPALSGKVTVYMELLTNPCFQERNCPF